MNEVSKQMKPVVEKLRQQYKDSLTEVEKKYKEIDQSKLSHIWITYETVQRLVRISFTFLIVTMQLQ